MKRSIVVSVLFIVVAMSAIHWTAPRMALAESASPDQMVIVVVDGAAARHSDQGVDLTISFIGLVAMLPEGRPITLISADDPSDVVGPFATSDPEFEGTQDEIATRLRSLASRQDAGLADALVQALSLFTRGDAEPGSSVYVITGDYPGADFEQVSRHLRPFVDRFGDNGWPIQGISLPGASTEALSFLESLSAASAEQVIELSASGGLQQLGDTILFQAAKGSLAEVDRRTLMPSEIMTSVVSVTPGTREVTLLFFKESPYGSLRLSNPSGFEASAGDRTASYVIETPHATIWRLIEPAPGNWKIDVRGMEGLVSAWEYSVNRYVPVFRSSGPVPLNKPVSVSAYVQEGETVAALEGVRLFAHITTPEGARLVQEMKDNGLEGDAAAEDGFYAMILPPLRAAGDYKVRLELSWVDYNHTVSTQGGFHAQAFPIIQVTPVQLGGLEPGERTKVATVVVHVQGEPYPVPVEVLTASLSSPAGQEGTLELEPRRLFGDGPAWEYDVFFTAQERGMHSQMFHLNLEYAGRLYAYTSNALLLSSEAPQSPVEPATAPVAPAPRSSALTPPPPRPQVESSSVPWAPLAFGMVLLAALAVAAAVYLITRPRPHGYLYNDTDEPLVDFAQVKKHPILELFFRGLVRGRELNVPGLEGVVFHFSRKRVELRSVGEHQTIRVNNQPLIGRATIEDRTWIGTRGKLFTFVLSPSPAEGGASAD